MKSGAFDLTLDVWLVALFAVAALLHGVAGMGFPLLTVGVLSGTHGLAWAVLMVLVPTAMINLWAWLFGGGIWHNLTHYIRRYWALVLVSVVGSALGAYLLLVVDAVYLTLVLSLTVLWYAISSLMGRSWILPNTLTCLVVVGFLAGVIGGATNAMSSVLLMYLLSLTNDRLTIIKLSNLCYFANKLVQMVVFAPMLAQIPLAQWGVIGVLTVLALGFLVIGVWLSGYLPKPKFRLLILWVLFGLGLKLLVSSLMTLMG